MHNAAIRVEWDQINRKEVEEAKLLYINARKEGRKILDLDNKPVISFSPSLEGFVITQTELKETQFAVRVFDKNGDRRIIWDRSDPSQLQEAKDLFNDYISRGWKAYGISQDGKKSKRIHAFDPLNEEVIFEEKSIKEKFLKFIETFKEIKILPRTYPG